MAKRMIPALVWTLMLVAACLVPDRVMHVNESRVHVGISHFDKLVHGILFAGFGFFWIQAVQSRRGLLGVLVVGFLLAVLTELGQGLPIIGRDTDPLDGLADVVGLLIGLGGAYALNGIGNGGRVSLSVEPLDEPCSLG